MLKVFAVLQNQYINEEFDDEHSLVLHSSHNFRMVGQLVQDYPHLMLEHVSRLKECLDYYTFLHPTSASFLIHSIGFLFQLSSDLQVTVFLLAH